MPLVSWSNLAFTLLESRSERLRLADLGSLDQHVTLYRYLWMSRVHIGFTISWLMATHSRLFSWALASLPEPWATRIWWSGVCLLGMGCLNQRMHIPKWVSRDGGVWPSVASRLPASLEIQPSVPGLDWEDVSEAPPPASP